MMRKPHWPTFTAQVVQELLKQEKTLAHLATEYGVHPTQRIKWQATALQGLTRYLAFYNRERPHQALNYRPPAALYFHPPSIQVALEELKG